jgi:hypothetical protein
MKFVIKCYHSRDVDGRKLVVRTVNSRRHGWFDAQKTEENIVMVLIKWSLETPRPPCIDAWSMAGMTSRRPQVNSAQYPGMPGRVIRHAHLREVFFPVIAKVMMSRTADEGALKRC